LTYPDNSVLRFLGGLQYSQPPNAFPVGQQWVPDDTKFQPSRGLVALVTYDSFLAGENFNKGTLTTTTVGNGQRIDFRYVDPPPQGNPVMHRTPPALPTPNHPTGVVNFDHCVSTIAHEFGHSFNLGDEYEVSGDTQDPVEATGVKD